MENFEIRDLMTIREVMALKGLRSRQTIYNAIKDGKIIAVNVLGRQAITRVSAEAWTPAPPADQRAGLPRFGGRQKSQEIKLKRPVGRPRKHTS